MKLWLEQNDIEMNLRHNEGKSIVAERFIKTLKEKLSQQTFILMKTSWRRLEDVFCLCLQKISSRRLQDFLIKTNIFALIIHLQKTSLRRLQAVLIKTNINIGHTFSRRLQDVFKTSSRHHQDVFKIFWIRLQVFFKTSLRRLTKTPSRRLAKTFSRHLQEVFKTFWRSLQDIFKTSSRCLAKMSSRRFQDVSSG